MDNDLNKHNMSFIGIALPSVWVGAIVFLVLISFLNRKVSSIIAAENLILLTLIFLPVVCITGAVISIIALAKSKTRKNAFCATVINIALLVCWVYFNKSFLIELELIN